MSPRRPRNKVKWSRPRFLMSPNCLMTFNKHDAERNYIHVHGIHSGWSQHFDTTRKCVPFEISKPSYESFLKMVELCHFCNFYICQKEIITIHFTVLLDHPVGPQCFKTKQAISYALCFCTHFVDVLKLFSQRIAKMANWYRGVFIWHTVPSAIGFGNTRIMSLFEIWISNQDSAISIHR